MTVPEKPLNIKPTDRFDAASLAERVRKGAEKLFADEGWQLVGETNIPGPIEEDASTVLRIGNPVMSPEQREYAERLLDYLAACLVIAERSGLGPDEQQELFQGEAYE